MATNQAMQAVRGAMRHWASVLGDAQIGYYGSDLREVAYQAIRLIDARLAPASETAYLGAALDDLSARSAPTEQAILDALRYWDAAYQAEYEASPSEGQPDDPELRARVAELILHGDADEALRIATGA